MSAFGSNRPSIVSHVTADAAGNRVVRLVGDVDPSTCSTFRTVLGTAAEDYDRELILDLTDVGFMDSSGLHALMEITRRITARGGSVTLHNPGHTVRRLLEISGLGRYFRVTQQPS